MTIKSPYLDTHRHFRPAIEISRIFPIACGGLELKMSNLKNEHACVDSPCFLNVRLLEKLIVDSPYLKNKGYPMHTSEFALHLNCVIDSCFYTWDTQLQLSYLYFLQLYIFICIFVSYSYLVYIYIYILLFFC